MTMECPEVDSGRATVRRSSSKSFKGIIRIFKPDVVKASTMKIRIPSFRETRKHSSTAQNPPLQKPENLLKEIPALDFQKLKADLYVDLAYTNNLLRQRVHRDNLTNMVAQITECLRLIRCRVATATAYIQTDAAAPIPSRASLATASGSSVNLTTSASEPTEGHYYSENRVILEGVSRFENAYVAFAGWLTELAALNPPSMDVFPAPLGGEMRAGQTSTKNIRASTSTTVNSSSSAAAAAAAATTVIVTRKSGLRVTLPLPLTRFPPSPQPLDSSLLDGVVTPDDVGEVMARGNACFLAIQTAAESVFLSLEASGCTQPTTPQALSSLAGTPSPLAKAKQSGFFAFHFSRATPSPNGKATTASGANPVSTTTPSSTKTDDSVNESTSPPGGGLTPEDRHLLAQLWLQVEPTGSSPPPPPPKPPLALESPRWSAGESLADLPASPLSDCPEAGYTNVRADAKLSAYLRSLAEAVQLVPVMNGSTGKMEESIYAKIDSPGPNLPPPIHAPSPTPPELPPRNVTKPNQCLNLDSLDLPHADDSDASEKENEIRGTQLDDKDCRVGVDGGGPHCVRLGYSLNSKTASSPPPPPPPSLPCSTTPAAGLRPLYCSVGAGRKAGLMADVNKMNGCSEGGPWEPLELTTLPNSLVTSLAECEAGLLSDTSMQGEVLTAVRRIQNGAYKEKDRQNKTSGSEPSPGAQCCDEVEGGDGGARHTPCCHAETKSDTEDDFEMIFANGKKYKRYFKRHIVFQRHVCRQVVVAPSLPDGSGPDLSRQVPQGQLQACRLDSMHTCLAEPMSTKSKFCPFSAQPSEVGCLRMAKGDEVASASTSTTAPSLGEDSSTSSSSSGSNGKPPAPPTSSTSSSVSSTSNNTLTSYMYKFGRSEPQDPGLETRICRNVAEFFHTKWCKRESAQGPHERSKTVAYVQKYTQPTPSGPPIQHNTCAQQTCRVRMVGGLEEIKQQVPSIPIVYAPSTENLKEGDSSGAAFSPSATASTLPRSSRDRSVPRAPLPAVDRRIQRVRPTSNLLLPLGEAEGQKNPLRIEVPSGSQPLLTEAVSPEFHDHHCRSSQRKGSFEGSSLEIEGEVDSEGNFLPSPICLVSVELPSVEEAERLHPLLLELDATPYLELDNSNSENELQVQAGTVDALLVYATSLGRSHRLFLLTLDVFLVMYRTFVTSEELISLLIQRYLLFQSSIKLIASVDEKTRERICNVVVSYLVRVISQLSTDMNSQIYSLLGLFRERVMDDGYGGLARVLSWTLSSQLKRYQQRHSSIQSQEVARQPSASVGGAVASPLISLRTSENAYVSSPATPAISSNVLVRRSHSIGAVAGTAATLSSPPLKKAGSKVATPADSNASSSSPRNSSIGQVGEHSLQSSPTASTTALSDIDFEAASASGVAGATMAGGRHSTASCLSSPTASRRLIGTSLPISIATLRRHSRTFVPGGGRRTSLLDIPAKQLAEQITYLEAEKYSRLTLEELLDIKSLAALKAPVMAACAAQFTALSNWASTLLLAPPASQRECHALKLLKVMNCLHSLKNFNSFLAILCAFLLVPENIFPKKIRARLARLRPYMHPPHFTTYRRELAEASPPLIPYLGLTLQNLIALEQINPLFLSETPKGMIATYKPEHGPIVNFWRSWKHFLIINFFVKQDSTDGRAPQYDIKPDLDILDFIADFKSAYSDLALRELINRRKRETS